MSKHNSDLMPIIDKLEKAVKLSQISSVTEKPVDFTVVSTNLI